MSRATGRRDINKAGGEEAEFPILCETCLGPNPYVRMSKQPLGSECKVCTRPFTVFKWQPGTSSRYKKTEVCQTCAKSRNVCQTCLLDLQFGLPTQVRDTALGMKNQAPTSDINREYYAQNVEAAIESGIEDGTGGGGVSGAVNFGRADPAGKELLRKLARKDPGYHRNRAHLCSFYAKGSCNRGDACPYRHEMPPEETALSKQNIKDRFYGTNDPVARKMLAQHAAKQGLTPPDDTSITSLYFSNVPPSHNDQSKLTSFILPLITATTSSAAGQANQSIKSIVPVAAANCAFINFKTRKDAEEVAEKLAMRNIAAPSAKVVKISLGEQDVTVQWGRPRKAKAGSKPAPAAAETA